MLHLGILIFGFQQGYDGKKKFAVLYMHDGQALYDSTTTWSHQSWDVDDVSETLLAEGKIKNFIVVGIWNGGQTRHSDYFPSTTILKVYHKRKKILLLINCKQQEELKKVSNHNQTII